MNQLLEVVVTSPVEWMQPFVDSALDAHLIAAGHLTPISTTYRWEGSVFHRREVRAHLHTSTDRAEELIETIVASHPFQVPCITSQVLAATPDYAAWVAMNCKR